MLKEITQHLRQCPPLERILTLATFFIAGLYILHFGFLSFLNSPWDFDHLAGYYEIAWRFWNTQEFPAGFNPFIQGGRTLGGDPQVFLFSPWTVLAGISPLMAVKLQMLAEVSVGAWGLWKLCGYFSFTTFQSLWSLFLFLTFGGITSRMSTGHVTLGYVFFYPLLLWLSLSFKNAAFWREKRFLAYLLVFAYLGNHKPNFFIYGLPPLFFECILRSFLERKFRALLELTLACSVAVLVNTASLLPSLYYFKEFPRHDSDEWVTIPLYTYFANLLMPLRSLPSFFYGPRFLQRHEYNLFLGPLCLYFSFRGMTTFYQRYRVLALSLLLSSILFIWVGLGATSQEEITAYSFFYKFWPGFHSVRVPPRFWFFSAFALCTLSGFGVRQPQSWVGQCVFFSLGIVPLFLSGAINISKPSLEHFPERIPPARTYLQDISWKKNDVRYQLNVIRRGQGVLESIENLTFPRAELKETSALTFVSDTPISAHFSWKGWSKIQFKITSTGPSARVSLNLNSHPYWQIRGQGRLLKSRYNDPLTIEVGSGNSLGTLEFKQPMAFEGLVVTLLSVGLILIYAVWVILGSKQSRKKAHRIIGLTGGIGSGKSTVAALFREEGIPVIDMDQIGREIIGSNTSVQKKILAICGKEVGSGGTIDRKKIREIVFADPQKRKALERLLHPLIWKEFNRQAKSFFSEGKSIVLCEAALLIENRRFDLLDGLIVVMADENTRKQRLLERDKISEELAHQIFKTQVTDDARREYATYIIENQAGFYDLKEKVRELVRGLS